MILLKEKRVVLANDIVVSILQDSADRPDSGKVLSPEQVSSSPLRSSKVRVARLTVEFIKIEFQFSLPPRAEVCVDVLCKRLFEGAGFSPDRLHNRQEAARYY
jgi:hypothetical protein